MREKNGIILKKFEWKLFKSIYDRMKFLVHKQRLVKIWAKFTEKVYEKFEKSKKYWV